MSAARRARILVAFCLAACTQSRISAPPRELAPESYRVLPNRLDRSVGLLRRMCFAGVRLEASPRDPRWCLDRCDTPAYAEQLGASAVRFLEDWRGYDVVPGAATAAPSAAELGELARWGEERESDDPPAPLRARVQQLGRASGCDAVLLIHGRLVYLTWVDGLAWVATLTFAIPVSAARIGTRVWADVYEVRTGELAWSHRVRAGGSPNAEVSRFADLGRTLFEPLELALPRVMTRPL